MKLKDFAVIFAVMCEYFEATPSEGLSQIYYEDLKNISIDEFKNAFQTLRKTRVFKGLPKVAEILEAIYGKPEDRVGLAYHTLIETIKRVGPWETVIFEDGAIGRVVEALGGWELLNRWTADDWKYRKKDFDQLYMANLRSGRIKPIRLLGIFDLVNGMNGREGCNIPILVTKDMKFLPKPESKQITQKKEEKSKEV